MHFLTVDEARSQCAGVVELGDHGYPHRPDREPVYARAPLPELAQLTHFCRQLDQALQPRDACLLWVTEWGVWESSENRHLYYRLRQSYRDQRLLKSAPAHLFLDYEAPDLVTFLQVGLICGWDMHLISYGGYARAFVSHDEYVDFTAG